MHFCVGGRHYSGIKNVRGFLTSKGTKMLKRNCTKCKSNKSMNVSDATIEAEGVEDFLGVLVKLQITFERKLLIIQ